MNIIVTGAGGFIGSHVVEHFSKAAGNMVFAIHHSATGLQQIQQLCSTQKIDVVINAAGSPYVTNSVKFPAADFEANTNYHLQLLDIIKDIACKYIYFSSAAVYGNPARLPIAETDKINPLSPYGWHKSLAEQIAREFALLYAVNTASLRLFSVYGPGQKNLLFFDLYKKCIATTNTVEIHGAENDSRDFIYIADVMQAVDIIIASAVMQGGCYNIASGTETKIKDAVEAFVQLAAPGKAISYSGNSMQGYPSNWKADISLIAGMGFKPKTNFEQGLKETIQWLKENV